MSDDHPYRLVTFLGKPIRGKYDTTTYVNPIDGELREIESCFIAEALTRFLKPTEVLVLATKEAWDFLGDELRKIVSKIGDKKLEWRELPPGKTERELWEQFSILKEALRLPEDTSPRRIALDITHGFRSQPFFTAGAVTFIQLIDKNPPDISIYYGAFDYDREKGRTAIWDLTPLIDLISWSSNIMLLLKTGRGEGLSSATNTIGRALRKEWALAGKKDPPPNLDKLGKVLGRFAGDLETVRTGALMLGRSSTRALVEAIENAKDTGKVLPPLSDVLNRIKELVSPLITEARLSEPEGIKALQTLARTYYEMGRYAEAASTIREAYINKFADNHSDCPGDPLYNKEYRETAEKEWYEANKNLAREIAQIRNDIEHAGYRSDPMPPNSIKEKIKNLIDRLGEQVSK